MFQLTFVVFVTVLSPIPSLGFMFQPHRISYKNGIRTTQLVLHTNSLEFCLTLTAKNYKSQRSMKPRSSFIPVQHKPRFYPPYPAYIMPRLFKHLVQSGASVRCSKIARHQHFGVHAKNQFCMLLILNISKLSFHDRSYAKLR